MSQELLLQRTRTGPQERLVPSLGPAAVDRSDAHAFEPTSAAETVLQLTNVTRTYDLGATKVQALRGVSLRIGRGEFLSVWGPSGSGKSTLMNILGLVDAPSTGLVTLCGTPLLDFAEDVLADLRNRYIGFVFQSFQLIPVLSALENVIVPLRIAGVAKAEATERAMAMLRDVGCEAQARSRPDHLSGGQRQRVAIARALVTQPSLVIADEPTANLDSHTSYRIMELMRELNLERAVTFVFTTHDSRLLEQVDRTILLRDGLIHGEEGSP